jgi:hypothetical protein
LTTKNIKKISSKSYPGTSAGLSHTACTGRNIEIRVKGQLSEVWADWFAGLTIDQQDNGEMVLSGTIIDQSALMGVLDMLARLNLTLISVNEITKQKETK